MIGVTELEERLAADPEGLLLRELRDTLAQAAARYGQAQRQPQTPPAYARLERQRLACLAAMGALDTIWQRLHRVPPQFR